MPPVSDDVAIAEFLRDLAGATVGATTNQYSAEDPGLDRPGAAARRLDNLGRHLRAHLDCRLLLVGEAPSYQGARFSGVAFTSERDHLPPEHWTSLRPDGWREPSATIVHRTVASLGLAGHVALWNAVPTHPAASGPLTNRPPTRREIDAGREWLERLIDVLRPQHVVAVGRSAGSALPSAPVVRHPAHGGAVKFREGLIALVDPSHPDPLQPGTHPVVEQGLAAL